MPGSFDRQRAIRYFRLPADADDARVAKAIRSLARRRGRMRRFFAEHPGLDPAECLAAVEHCLAKEEDRMMALDANLQDLIDRRKKALHKASFAVMVLNAILFSCYAPDSRGSENG